MQVVSTGNSTILSDFQGLATKYTYPHPYDEVRDFQFFASNGVFVECNRSSIAELMRVRSNGKELMRVLKLKVDGLSCVGCPKQSQDEIAFGLGSGQVKLFNYKISKFIHVFESDLPYAVLSADFNSTDDYLLSTLENGQVNLYGTQTNTKFQMPNMDVAIARFHPTERFLMTAVSEKGTAFVYDVQAHRKVFQKADSHMAPCHDLCMSPTAPQTLITVGFDCVINIFDTRSKVVSVCNRSKHPLSAVAISKCGLYFCVGSLMGELSTFDIRNTNDVLYEKQVHRHAIARIAILPADSYPSNLSTDISEPQCSTPNISFTASEVLPSNSSISMRAAMESICDDVEFHSNIQTSWFRSVRETFNWEALRTKSSNEGRPKQSNSGAVDICTGNFSDGSFDKEAVSFDFVYTRSRRRNCDDSLRKNLFSGRLSSIEDNCTSHTPNSTPNMGSPSLCRFVSSRETFNSETLETKNSAEERLKPCKCEEQNADEPCSGNISKRCSELTPNLDFVDTRARRKHYDDWLKKQFFEDTEAPLKTIEEEIISKTSDSTHNMDFTSFLTEPETKALSNVPRIEHFTPTTSSSPYHTPTSFVSGNNSYAATAKSIIDACTEIKQGLIDDSPRSSTEQNMIVHSDNSSDCGSVHTILIGSDAETESSQLPVESGTSTASYTKHKPPLFHSTLHGLSKPELTTNSNADVIKALTDFRQEMRDSFNDLEFKLEQNKWEFFSQNFKLRWEQARVIQDVADTIPFK